MKGKKELSLKNALDLKLNFIKTNFRFVEWEDNVRKNQKGQDLQLVSERLNKSTAKLCLARIRKLLNIESQNAVCIVPSRSDSKQYRLLIQLNAFTIPKKLQTIEPLDGLLCTFLNEISRVSYDLYAKNKEDSLHFQWKVINKQIALIAPAQGYNQNGMDVEDWLINIFEENSQFTKDFKDKYKEALIVDRQKKQCVFHLENKFLHVELLPHAKVYYEQKLKPHLEEVASQAFSDQLPKEIGKAIGFFISIDDAGKLAQTCKNASLAAKGLKKAGDESLKP